MRYAKAITATGFGNVIRRAIETKAISAADAERIGDILYDAAQCRFSDAEAETGGPRAEIDAARLEDFAGAFESPDPVAGGAPPTIFAAEMKRAFGPIGAPTVSTAAGRCRIVESTYGRIWDRAGRIRLGTVLRLRGYGWTRRWHTALGR